MIDRLNYTISKTGVNAAGNAPTTVSTDALGTTTVTMPCNGVRDLSVQISGAGTITPTVSNDGVTFVAYGSFTATDGTTLAPTLTNGLFFRPFGQHFAYLRLATAGLDATTQITVHGV